MPAFKYGHWDGFLKLMDARKKLLYRGLVYQVAAFCIEREYVLQDLSEEPETPISLVEVEEYMKELSLPSKFTIRDYQIEAIAHGIRRNRSVLVSPTGSGKSLLIYSLLRWYDCRSLLIVPTINLVRQMYSDFEEYSKDNDWSVMTKVSQVMGGYSKENLNQVVVSTWQSMVTQPKSWFEEENFGMVIVDECHLANARSIVSILEALKNCNVRIGLTGTIQESKVHRLILEGLLGRIYKVIDTRTLIDQKHLSDINIRCLVLKYSKKTRKELSKDYQSEIQFIIGHERRNKFIANLALSLKGSTLVLFNFVQKHGEILHDLIKQKAKEDTEVFFVFGGTELEVRDDVRKIVDSRQKKCIIVASVKVFQLGVNIVHLENVILASPSKSRIRNLQSIGRGLRRADGKEMFNLFDIADDISKSKAQRNYTLNHFAQRLKYYKEEKFKYQINTIQIEDE